MVSFLLRNRSEEREKSAHFKHSFLFVLCFCSLQSNSPVPFIILQSSVVSITSNSFFFIELYTQRNVGPNSIAIFYVSVCVPVRVFVFLLSSTFFFVFFYFLFCNQSRVWIFHGTENIDCVTVLFPTVVDRQTWAEIIATLQFVFLSFFSLKAILFCCCLLLRSENIIFISLPFLLLPSWTKLNEIHLFNYCIRAIYLKKKMKMPILQEKQNENEIKITLKC